ncbi:MAG: RidA family protein [Pseudorhodoplanes sp.]|nr:RidA family protein [Pseudorhodoplanes sp.]
MSKNEIEVLRSDAVLPRGLPFPDGVRVGDLLILSGQIGVKPGTLELAPGGVEGEARQVFENLRRILAAHGGSLKDVVRVQVMLADMGEWQRFNAIYLEFFPDAAPARSAFGANGLALGARVEIEVFAVRR